MIKYNFKKGFTLLEALVAISILMLAVVAPITIAQKGLSSAVYSKNQMIASYLAQDAIEYIKNKRDSYYLSGGRDSSNSSEFEENVLSIFSSCIGDNNSCQIDTINESLSDPDSTNINKFSASNYLLKDDNGFYQYDDGGETNFTRQINIEFHDLSGRNDEALVTVKVRWGVDEYVTVRTLIYNIW